MKRLLAACSLALAGAAASATVLTYVTELRPETLTATGFGSAVFTYDTDTLLLHFDVDWSGLSAPTTVAHIHCCLANSGGSPLAPPAPGASPTIGVAVTPVTLPGFPTGVTSGHYEVDVDLGLASSYTGGATGFLARSGGTVAQAREALLAGMADGRAYLNIHTSANPGGEIRGFITVPEPASLALAGLAVLAAAGSRRGRDIARPGLR